MRMVGLSASTRERLNEGLPQKGKRFLRAGVPRSRRQGLNEGLPQKGKRCPAGRQHRRPPPLASMKGFPRRGSDMRAAAGLSASGRLNEGLPQKGKRSVRRRAGGRPVSVPQ